MNEHDIESLLQSLPPAAPSAALARRVDSELEQDMQWARQPQRRPVRWLAPVMWSSLGAAAAVLVMSVAPQAVPAAHNRLAQAVDMPALLPVTTIREVVDTQDQGIRYNSQSLLPEQHVLLVSLERHAWTDPRDGAQITVEVPREESVVLPVAFQ